MDFNRLLVFHTVTRRLSFSQAADELYTSQPNVSRQIAKLESELGLPLFQRVGNKVALTDAGRLVEDYAQRTLELTDSLQRSLNELKGLERGYLRLAAGSTSGLYLLPRAVAGFQALHPGVEITLHVANSQAALDLVLRSQADLAFIETTTSAPAVQMQPYARDELLLVAAPSHPLATGGPPAVQDLAQATLLLREPGSGTRQVTEQALQRRQVTPEHVQVVNHSEAIKQMVMAGMGVSFLSQRAAGPDIERSLLVVIGGEEWRISYQLSVASRKDIRPPMTALSFLAYMRKRG
jgi:LysR family transcriptional regulator, low CO2-responsive transcriptional regulator